MHRQKEGNKHSQQEVWLDVSKKKLQHFRLTLIYLGPKAPIMLSHEVSINKDKRSISNLYVSNSHKVSGWIQARYSEQYDNETLLDEAQMHNSTYESSTCRKTNVECNFALVSIRSLVILIHVNLRRRCNHARIISNDWYKKLN